MNFIVYDPTSGAILRTGSCPDSMVAIQAKEHEEVVEGEAHPERHLVRGGQVVEIPVDVLHGQALVIEHERVAQERERTIQQRVAANLRRQAVNELIQEGAINAD
jgi:hypothetical protein